jgi:5-methylcytosine-specific restriction protein B
VESILRRKGQVILYGPPGTGKTHHAITTARELAARQAFGQSFASLDRTEREAVEGTTGLVRVCTFHPGYSYEDFVEGLRPFTGSNGHLEFKPRNGIFKQLCEDARTASTRHFFLVIDEINRGDVARILGELMTILELDKRSTSVILPTTQSAFSVPPNVFILATMNTADRSISLLDAALRRRFGFLELMPASAVLKGVSAGAVPLGPWLDALNARLRQHLKRDARSLQIGHSYLMTRPPITSVAEFSRVLRDDIIPLLEEYCYDDFNMLREILGGDLVDVERGCIREEIFASNREDDLVKAISFEQMESLTLSESEEDEPEEPDATASGAE